MTRTWGVMGMIELGCNQEALTTCVKSQKSKKKVLF